MCTHISRDLYAHISFASCLRVSITSILPDPVENVPAVQRLQSTDPAEEDPWMQNQSMAGMIIMNAAV